MNDVPHLKPKYRIGGFQVNMTPEDFSKAMNEYERASLYSCFTMYSFIYFS